MEAEKKELAELLGKYDTALLTTRGPDGHFHTRPMAVQARPFEDDLWFATWMDSQKVADLEAEPHCGVSFYGGGRSSTYVSISGMAEVVHDRKKIHELWDPSWKAWFPEGPDSEDLALIRVQPEHAEWVHPTTGKLKVWATMVRRIVTHERVSPAEKKELDLH